MYSTMVLSDSLEKQCATFYLSFFFIMSLDQLVVYIEYSTGYMLPLISLFIPLKFSQLSIVLAFMC